MEFVPPWLPYATTTLFVVVSLLATAHVVLNKRSPRSAAIWVALIWLSPFIGTILYGVYGINRIRRRAVLLNLPVASDDGRSEKSIPPDLERRRSLMEFTDKITPFTLRAGNSVTPLVNGEETYPAMLAAIDAAKTSISLSTYIFDNDHLGKQFIKALAKAKGRGVAIRVLIDGVGARYSWPSTSKSLRRAGVDRVAHFFTNQNTVETSLRELT